MISKEQREKDKTICEAATKGRWEYSPMAGVHVSDGERWTSIAFPEGVELADVNGEAIAHAHNRLPAYIADAEEMERRIALLDEMAILSARAADKHAAAGEHASANSCRAKSLAFQQAARVLRGEP